uniref:Elongation of very long chain fatty acids protein 4 n=1 Tax=Schistocephalus solidus TaxID=70667 RepID=A0A0X3PVU2_SCHSO
MLVPVDMQTKLDEDSRLYVNDHSSFLTLSGTIFSQLLNLRSGVLDLHEHFADFVCVGLASKKHLRHEKNTFKSICQDWHDDINTFKFCTSCPQRRSRACSQGGTRKSYKDLLQAPANQLGDLRGPFSR